MANQKPLLRETEASNAALIASLPDTRNEMDGDDKFALSPADLIPGVTREWKRHTLLGQVDVAHESMLRQRGWVPVTTKELPHLMPPDALPSDPVIREGMMLWQRREKFTLEDRAHELAKAADQKNMKTRQLGETPSGHANRVVQRFSKTVEAVQVPTKDDPL